MAKVGIREQVLKIVEAESGKAVQPESSLESLGLDSLETLDLFLTLGEVGQIPDSAIPSFEKVQDIISYLETQQNGCASSAQGN